MAMQMLGEMKIMLGNQADIQRLHGGPIPYLAHRRLKGMWVARRLPKKSVCKLIINVLALLTITSLII